MNEYHFGFLFLFAVMNMNRARSKTNEPMTLKRLHDPARPKAIPK